MDIADPKKLKRSQFVNVVSMPGIGIDYIIEKYFSERDLEYQSLDSRLFEGSNAGKDFVNEIVAALKASQQQPAILVVKRFDRAGFQMTKGFFSRLRIELEQLDRIALVIYTTNFPFAEHYKEELVTNFSIIGETIYVKALNYESFSKFEAVSKKDFDYTGGHQHLVKSLDSGKRTELTDKISEELLTFVSKKQKDYMIALAQGEKAKLSDEEYQVLNQLGYVEGKSSQPQLFCQAFADYLQERQSPQLTHLTALEKKLYDALLHNKDKMIDKDSLIESVWGEEGLGEVSDWALNSLIYRLKNNPKFKETGYKISNIKKQGYILYR